MLFEERGLAYKLKANLKPPEQRRLKANLKTNPKAPRATQAVQHLTKQKWKKINLR
jgi:hypothetical protein